MTKWSRSVGLSIVLAICAAFAWAGTPQSRMYTVTSKSSVTIPEQYRQPTPLWDIHVGSWLNEARHQTGDLYLHRIEKLGWKYKIKDDRGRIFTLYAGRDWNLSPGTILIISGEPDRTGVFIPQGERYYAK